MGKPAIDSRRQRLSVLRENISTLNPAYFALVMATGIVSIACDLLGMPRVAQALFYLNALAFPVLWILHAVRLAVAPRQLLADLVDHKRGVGFFTSVAASCVLGSQFLLFTELRGMAVALWSLGTVLWLIFTYTIFTNLAVKQIKPSLPEGIHGGWLVSVVGTQSVALLGAMLSNGFGDYSEQVLFFALTMW